MHVVTFYSFKGGVGRTMALTNVAVELAGRGYRVLIVDFDLEAPGIDTLALGADPVESASTPGIVEFVHDYLQTGVVPDVREYVYDCAELSPSGGKLWVMPAGRADARYPERLGRINWADLYAFQDGYILFEDLKAQWQELYAPDYVLIDSRTGHTDVGGICTRQLPDAAVLVFIPNEQNLRGLEDVVRGMRAEAFGPREKRITLHFVMSNVPDLDDEDEILAGRLRAFRRVLAMQERPFVVHRYDSLSLLAQSLFTRDRPRSRLAREYRQLTKQIQRANPSDAAGARMFLNRVLRDRAQMPAPELDRRLEVILERHGSHPDVLLRLAEVRQRQGRADEAIALLSESAVVSQSDPASQLSLAESHRMLGRSSDAAREARRIFDRPDVDAGMLAHAIQILRATDSSLIHGVSETPAVRSLDSAEEWYWLATQLESTRAEWREAVVLLERALAFLTDSAKSSSVSLPKELVWHELVLAFLGLGEFKHAYEMLAPRLNRPDPQIGDVFNAGMAAWGRDGEPPNHYFRLVAHLNTADASFHPGANFHQCLAVTCWQVGERERALAHLDQAQSIISMKSSLEFSCWRYQRVTADEFASDLAEIRRAVLGHPVTVPFLQPE